MNSHAAAAWRVATVLLLACMASGCVTYSKVVAQRPRLDLRKNAESPLVTTEKSMVQALRIQRKQPGEALSVYIASARSAALRLRDYPTDAQAIHDYNFATSRIVATVEQADLDPWSGPVKISGKAGSFVLTHKKDNRRAWNPTLYEFTPSDQFGVRGIYVNQRITRPGVGAPVVAVAREVNPEAREKFSLSRVYYGVTAVARFKGDRCEIAFEDPLASETTRLDGRTVPMAADFTVPLAAMLEDDDNNPKKQGLSRYLNPEKYRDTFRISRLEPYSPDKTIVLVIHGLTDSQATWTPLINSLRGDETIRRNFQFWFFSYPTGYPYPYSAMMLRRELARLNVVVPGHKPIVVIGHSMGGCISRLLITDTDDKLWKKIFKRAPRDTPMSVESKKLFTEALIFDSQSDVGRVVFMSAPLKGSVLAENWVGRIGSSLIKMPLNLLEVGTDALQSVVQDSGDLKVKQFPDSVDTLAPNNRFVKAINTIPVTPGIPHHVIAGDRGRGDAPDSSDGVVPYWSSHMDTAQSEKMVPSKHGTHQHPEGIAEAGRILKLHARSGR